MAEVTSRLCSMARAGCCRKRSSKRSISSLAGSAPFLSGIRKQTKRSIRSMKGTRTMTVARRKRVFKKAMETVVMVAVVKGKWKMALAM